MFDSYNHVDPDMQFDSYIHIHVVHLNSNRISDVRFGSYFRVSKC